MDDEEEYEFVMMHPEGGPGQLQQMLGDAGYEAYLEQRAADIGWNSERREAEMAMIQSNIDYADQKSDLLAAWTSLVSFVPVLLFMFSVPVIVFLWFWALG